MQQRPRYDDVVAELRDFLLGRVDAAITAGISAERLVLDPGFGFGKTLPHNLQLLRRLPELAVKGLPILVGLSRKSMLAAITGRTVDLRLPASVAAALLAAQRGAGVLRVHDVAATRDVLAVWQALEDDCPEDQEE
jgi:dihydropteroate synthase